jgi:RND family efflux transporter MFP subunit
MKAMATAAPSSTAVRWASLAAIGALATAFAVHAGSSSAAAPAPAAASARNLALASPQGAGPMPVSAPEAMRSPTPSPAARAAEAARAARQPVGCLIEPERVADIGSPVIGVVSMLSVDRGDTVSSGQPLATLQSDVERASVSVAQSRFKVDADINAAAANLTLAQQRLVRANELQRQGFVSPQATEQAQAEQDVAVQKLAQARDQKRISGQELAQVQAQLGQRTLRSPFAGVVIDRFVNPGERVEEKALLRVAMLDPLRVEIVVPASRYGSVAKGDSLQVQPDLPGVGAVSARVSHVDKMIDAASNTFRVRLSLPNPGNKLPAGSRCRVELAPMPATVATRS